MAEEEEVKMEVEAVQSVYGDDCVIIESYPPYLHLHIKPRTADVSSQQFVEAAIGIRASSQYPKEPPLVYLIDSKGLDEQRQTLLLTVERLSAMNHPDGDCPLCLYPLVSEDDQTERLPFMKLMSCFHCFHSECIIRWWNWLQIENKNNAKNVSSATLHLRNGGDQQDRNGAVEESMGNCPVCRKVFHAKDFEHGLDLVGSHSSQLNAEKTEIKVDEIFLHSDLENMRQKFEAISKLQQENCGLIGSKSEQVVLPSINPQNTFASSEQTSAEETSGQSQNGAAANSSSSSTRPTTSKHWNSGTRRQRPQNSRKHVKQWVRKDIGGGAD
ncbi:E3 ubiquitin-protein ligase RNF25 [Gossypium australe]|uniref:E3 ubiquitin-protein ligase RNF25 n=1 Tax=Gossypium australe TaxID=47621 RepID=A0A5B6UVE7_9ROSI|nr:E3 ubiquitin-protein ligase RNF25 [Gossypium australe]